MTAIWKRNPEKHGYPAALDYLTLLLDEKPARGCGAGPAAGGWLSPHLRQLVPG